MPGRRVGAGRASGAGYGVRVTQPQPTNRWHALRDSVGQSFRGGSGPRLWLGVGVGGLALIVLVAWTNSLATPAHRVGSPTASVSPLPATTAATPTPTATASGEPSASESPDPEPSEQPPRMKSSGKFAGAAVSVPAANSSGELRRYTFRVETSAKLKADKVARQVAGVLNDPRSWAGSGGVRFALVADPEKADFSITLAAPATAAKLCKPDAAGTCTEGSDVVIDAALWKAAPEAYAASAAQWQAYLVNHGLGHLLGEREAKCPKKARPAPVMMPQAGDLDGCTPNPWPYP